MFKHGLTGQKVTRVFYLTTYYWVYRLIPTDHISTCSVKIHTNSKHVGTVNNMNVKNYK